MTTYATNNPQGSMDPKDLFDNAQNLDYALNEITQGIWKDRFGRNRKSFWGMEQDFSAQLLSQKQRFDNFIQSSGYEVIGEYTSGPLTIDEYNQLIRYQNELWKLTAATNLPFTTSGNDAASWVNDSTHFVSVGDNALRQQISDPHGAIKYPELQIARWRDDGDVRGWGAVGDGVADDTAAVKMAFSEIGSGSVYFPEGTFLITGSIITDDKFFDISGAGISVTQILYRPNTPGVLFDHIHTVNTHGVMSFRDLTITTDVAGVGTAIKIEGKLTSESPQVNGSTDTLYLNRVRIAQKGTGYWNKFLHSVNNGGNHLTNVSFNNRVTKAQTDPSVIGILIESNDPRVSIIRALSANDIYILRTYVCVKTVATNGRGIESLYINMGEFVGVGKAAFAHLGFIGAVSISAIHFDVNEMITDASQGQFTNARYTGCDFRTGSAGAPYVFSPMFKFDYGEMVSFNGCLFSGYSVDRSNPEQYVFSFNNTYNGRGLGRFSVGSCVFRNFHHIYGTTPEMANGIASGNSYDAIYDTISAESSLDTSITLQDAFSCNTKTFPLIAAATQTISFDIPTKWYKDRLPYANIIQASSSGSDNLTFEYQFGTSTNEIANFTVKGNLTARTLRLSFVSFGIGKSSAA